MKGRTLLALTSSLAVLAVALPGSAVAKQGGTDRPVKGSGTGTTTVDLATLAASGQRTAIISHLGRTTWSENFTVTLTGATTFTTTGTATFVAANGDQLFATQTGSGTSTGIGVGETIDVTNVYTITGGTGRFADASGTLTARVDVTTVSLVGTTLGFRDEYSFEGRISY